ncbi:MAG TPA: alpha/beta fold hydrolase, partial [Verrucomicrobiae bacterium]|nr:alpha/beta fold hydrolase [Verrucomicrobiae bacterium]
PNTYPKWLEPKAVVELAFKDNFLTNFPAQFVNVGPPPARLCYRVVAPADFHLKVCSTNWQEQGRSQFQFTFHAKVPGPTNAWTLKPRGTVILLHGYGLAQFSMAPWALRLAENGWQCVLLDLRGHGKSTGKRIYYGTVETNDLSQLLTTLARDGQLVMPVAAIGESYGAALALRWKTVEPRLGSVIAIAPYAVLSNAVLNICHKYSPWFPQAFLKAGLKDLPAVLHVKPGELNTTTVMKRHPVKALFIAGANDEVMPVATVRKLYDEAAPGSEFILVPDAIHETVPYYFSEIIPPVLRWLNDEGEATDSVKP